MEPYDNYQSWKSWGEDDFVIFTKEESIYFRLELSRARVLSLEGLRVLEYGFGNGAFAGWAIAGGAFYTGIEVISDLVDRATLHKINAFQFEESFLNDLPKGGFDLVLAFDVFEHFDIESLRSELRRIFSLMTPGGTLLARVPSGDSPFSRAIQYGDITRKSVLGSSAIRQLSGETGFKVFNIDAPAFPVAGLGLRSLLRRSSVFLGRSLAFPILRKIFMGNNSAVISPNMVFVLVKP